MGVPLIQSRLREPKHSDVSPPCFPCAPFYSSTDTGNRSLALVSLEQLTLYQPEGVLEGLASY
eukprot:1157920-Pelagomonas_calceolata.AAC.9